jgi:hypothetical protein
LAVAIRKATLAEIVAALRRQFDMGARVRLFELTARRPLARLWSRQASETSATP